MSGAITLDDLPKFLDGIAAAMVAPKAEEPIRKTAQHIAGELGRGFQSSVDPSGTAWAPLKRPRPAGHNPGTRPLIDTGEMMLSAISDGSGHIEQVTGDSLAYGTSNWKAKIHQGGTARIPARPLVGWTKGSADYAVESVADHLVTLVGAL